jgi:competence protein ComEC
VATSSCELSGWAPVTRRSPRGLRALLTLAALTVTSACLAGPPPGTEAEVGSTPPPADIGGGLELHFLDVGQGDAVLIRAPDGRAVLYDGGQHEDRLLAALDRAGVTALEMVVASHNHADHIGGLVAAVERYRPRYIVENGIAHTTRTYERFLRAVAAAGSQRLAPTRRVVMLDAVRLTVIPPPGDPVLGHNDNSVGLLIEYGEFRATLMGDSERAQQRWWLEHHADLFGPVVVHKASHHGSRNGDTRAMLEAIRPAIVVIGVGTGNRYGHPHEEALALYRDLGADVYRTDLQGTITLIAHPDRTILIRRLAHRPTPNANRRSSVPKDLRRHTTPRRPRPVHHPRRLARCFPGDEDGVVDRLCERVTGVHAADRRV